MAIIKIHHGYAGNLSELDVNDFAFVEVGGAKFSVALLETLTANGVGRKYEVVSKSGDGVVMLRAHECGGNAAALNVANKPAGPAPAVAKVEPLKVEPKVEVKVEPKVVEQVKVDAPKAPEPAVPA